MSTIYLTQYDAETGQPSGPSQPMQAASLRTAQTMALPGLEPFRTTARMLLFNVGAGRRVALSDFRFA